MLGIAGIPLFLWIAPPVLAIVIGSKARKNLRADPSKTGFGMATAGFILGIIGTTLCGAFLLLFAASPA